MERVSDIATHTRSPKPLTPLLPLQVRGEAALAIEEERKIDDGAADEEEGNQVSLARDDEIEWPDEETEERPRPRPDERLATATIPSRLTLLTRTCLPSAGAPP